jgi:hypothetical protein
LKGLEGGEGLKEGIDEAGVSFVEDACGFVIVGFVLVLLIFVIVIFLGAE